MHCAAVVFYSPITTRIELYTKIDFVFFYVYIDNLVFFLALFQKQYINICLIFFFFLLISLGV